MEVAKSPNLEQSGVQMDSELPTLAADNHIEQVTGAVPTTNSRVVMTGKVAKSNSSGKISENPTNKRVIYIVAGDDGSHVPTLRQVKLHGEKASKSDAKTIAAACNLIEGAVGKQPVRQGTVHLNSDICQEQSTEVIDEDAERILAVKFEKSTNSVEVVPLAALPRGERRVIVQDGDEILLLWYKDEVFAIENRSPAEGAYSEGLLNAKLTQDGCIICPSTDSTFDLRSGEIKEWYPKNPVLRALTPVLRKLFVYPAKTDGENIYISIRGAGTSVGSAEILFSGKAQPGSTASDVNIEEVRMVVDEGVGGFGFTPYNELINGRAAIIGFLLLIDFELLTGKGLLRGTGLLDFIYAISRAFS